MSITISENAGFCSGVSRIDHLIKEELQKEDILPILIGEPIHNPVYINQLKSNHVCILSSFSDLSDDILQRKCSIVTRAHGITKEEFILLDSLQKQYPNLNIIDGTCPFVYKEQKLMEENSSKDSIVLYLGEYGHPEAKAVLSYSKGTNHIFSSYSEFENIVKSLKTGDKLLLFNQTTSSVQTFLQCKLFLENHFTNFHIFDTMCKVTCIRQNETEELSKESEIMIVIGGKNSANTNRLYEICCKHCKKTYFIESVDDVSLLPLYKDQKVGVVAGASTPKAIIKEIIIKWTNKNLNYC